MRVILGSVTGRKGAKSDPAGQLATEYFDRLSKYCPAELLSFSTERLLLDSAIRQPSRPAATLIVFDSRGEQPTSSEFARTLERIRDDGAQRILFGIGPADGWSAEALSAASKTYAIGRFTLPHELARAVAAEQIYRAFTILAGHPYHSGH